MQIVISSREHEIKIPTREQNALHFEIMAKWRERCAAMNALIPFYDATENTAPFLAWLIDDGYINDDRGAAARSE